MMNFFRNGGSIPLNAAVCFLIAVVIVPIQAGTWVRFRTTLGHMDFELLDSERPETVRNFLHYVRAGRYTNMFMHRLLPGYIAEMGGYSVDWTESLAPHFMPVPQDAGIVNETQTGVTQNEFGTLALGRISGRVEPLAGEFFLNLGNDLIPLLATNQGGYPVFARLVAGAEVIQSLNQFHPDNETNRLISIFDDVLPRDLFGVAQFPVTRFSQNARDLYDNLIYIDVTLLQVDVVPSGESGAVISWDSVEGRLQEVQYTDVMPPNWQSLTQRIGTGDRMEVRDENGRSTRFYRVLVDYGFIDAE